MAFRRAIFLIVFSIARMNGSDAGHRPGALEIPNFGIGYSYAWMAVSLRAWSRCLTSSPS